MNQVMLTRFEQLLAAAPNVARVAEPSALELVSPLALVDDVCVRYDEVWTTRIAACRSAQSKDAWLREFMTSFGPEPRCHIHPCTGESWWTITTTDPPRLAASLWNVEYPPPYLLLLSADGSRVGLVSDVCDQVYGVVQPVSECHERIALRARMVECLGRVAEVLFTARPPLQFWVRESVVFAGAPVSTLPRTASAKRRARWLSDCVERFRARHADPSVVRGALPDYEGAYYISLGGGAPPSWSAISTKTAGGWLGSAWEAGSLSKMLVMSPDQSRVLGIRTTAQKLEGFVAEPGKATA